MLDAHPELEALIQQDLVRGLLLPEQGRPGMTARQVLRVLVLKQLTQLSYHALAFAVADSATYGLFCGFARPAQVLRHSALQDNLARLTATTLEQLNAVLIQVAQEYGVETGTKTRIDCTVTRSNIHAPTGSSAERQLHFPIVTITLSSHASDGEQRQGHAACGRRFATIDPVRRRWRAAKMAAMQ